MIGISEIINSRSRGKKKLDDEALRKLPWRHAFIYGRLSSPGQVRDSRESVREIAHLVDLARADGYQTDLNSQKIELELNENKDGEKIWSEGQVTLDARDLGISGQLSFTDRKGLAELQRRVSQGEVGAVYLTEGVSRLSRDRDRILPYQLLKLLKEQQCRIRTPEGIWNPAIERDWDYLAEEFEDAIGELRVMNKRMFRRRRQKAARGEHVGEPVPPGFIVPVIGRKPNGEYLYGKLEPYLPHAEIVQRIIEELIKRGGSFVKTAHSLGGITFPFFPHELNYMERLTSLRKCPKTETGYRITWALVKGLARNPKLIGVWQWGDTEPIIDNHKPIVLENLFLEAYRLATGKGKPRGKAVNYEPMEWSGLLRCMNHTEPKKINSISSKGRYICNTNYLETGDSLCLDITSRFLEEPLTAAVLRVLDLTPFSEEVLSKLEAAGDHTRIEKRQQKQQIKRLEEEISKWQHLLPVCVDSLTGEVDREKEGFYWERIREIKVRLEEIRSKTFAQTRPIDYGGVREFLKGLSGNWYRYPQRARNNLLKHLIDFVELRGSRDIETTIIWKAGFRQKLIIHRPESNSKLERRWRKEEDELLTSMYPSSPAKTVMAALPGRSWKAITLRGRRLNLLRTEKSQHRWKPGEDEKLEQYLKRGLEISDIARQLGRTELAVKERTKKKGLSNYISEKQDKVTWEEAGLMSSHRSSSRGGYRG
jgi:hypothetical protein